MRRPAPRSDQGAAAVEFAIVSVLLLTLLFGILQYGYFFYQSTGIEHATREGARYAATNGAANLGPLVIARAPGGTIGAPGDVTTCYLDSDASGGYTRGDALRVSVEWEPTQFGLPFVPFLAPGALTEQALTRVERSEGITTVPGGC